MDNYKESSLRIIETAHILESSDFEVLNNLHEELNDTFLYAQVFRTRTEMEASVLNDLKFPTPDAKYWQAVREQNVMFNNMVLLSYEYRKNQVEIKMLQRDLDREIDELKQEIIIIEIDRKRFIALGQEREAKDRIREIREWHEIKQNLLPQMTYSLTDVNKHQLVSYTQRWVNQFVASGAEGSIPERNNLLSQLEMGLKMCREKGILKKTLEPYDPKIVKGLKKIFYGEGRLEEWLSPPKSSQPQLLSEKVS